MDPQANYAEQIGLATEIQRIIDTGYDANGNCSAWTLDILANNAARLAELVLAFDEWNKAL